MGRTVFVNGEYLDEQDAKVSIFDRGFLFSDSVYEVTAVINQKLVSWKGHIRRLRSRLTDLEKTLKVATDRIFDCVLSHADAAADYQVVNSCVSCGSKVIS